MISQDSLHVKLALVLYAGRRRRVELMGYGLEILSRSGREVGNKTQRQLPCFCKDEFTVARSLAWAAFTDP